VTRDRQSLKPEGQAAWGAGLITPREGSSLQQVWWMASLLMKIKAGKRAHKKMLKMKSAPQSLLKTKGQKKCSSGVTENKRVTRFSR